MGDEKISCLAVGMAQANCYLIQNTKTDDLLLLDPGAESERLLRKVQDTGKTVRAILLTHGHFDHIGAAESLAVRFRAKTYLGKRDMELAKDPELNCGELFGCPCSLAAEEGVSNGEELFLAGYKICVIETPGHTAGGVCYYFPEIDVLFSGDTLFLESVGRSDFPTGREELLLASIREKLFVLPETTVVYPGHGAPTTIGYEKKNNPFFTGEGIWN